MRQAIEWIRRAVVLGSAAVLVATAASPSSTTSSTHAAARSGAGALAVAQPAASGSSEPLLLVHGYNDSCFSAWTPTLSTDTTNPPQGPHGLASASNFLSSTGGFTDVRSVGYYTYETNQVSQNGESNYGCVGTSYGQGGAVTDASDVGSTADGSDSPSDKCVSIPHTHTVTVDETGGVTTTVTVDDTGTTNDPIRHVACRMAWYIYDTFTAKSLPVRILAHSMGGLVVRDAIAESGSSAAFPPTPLWVDRVVTVATPHGGLDGRYLTNARVFQDSTEVEDMAVGSALMNYLDGHQDPQGAQAGTFWGLVGGSQSCNPQAAGNDSTAIGNLGNLIHPSCTEGGSGTNPYTSGDGIIQSSSQLGMKADIKVLYGMVDKQVLNTEVTYTADSATQYGHEWGSGAVGVYVPGPFYLNDDGSGTTKAFVCAASCTSTPSNNPLGDMNLGANTAVPTPRALTEIAQLLTSTPTTYSIGHAVMAGNDYPFDGLGQYDRQALTDPWHEYDGQCDSFAAWKVYETLGGTARASSASIPNAVFSPADKGISPVVGYAGAGAPSSNWGDAKDWGTKARSLGITVDDNPAPGAIAWWAASSAMPVGHVGFVTDVYLDGSVTIENYNLRSNGGYSTLYMNRAGADDTSFNLPAFHVPWPSGYIHFAQPASNVTYPPHPTPSPTFHYPHNTYGPDGGGNGSSFTLAGSYYQNTVDGWYLDSGHGQIGNERWTNTHKGSADSTATWSPPLTSGSCYEVDAFVPDNWSNNAAALYTVADQKFGTTLVPVDENAATNAYVELGVFQARSDGTLPVTLTDQGSGNGQVAADAMRFLLQSSCSGAVRSSQTIGNPQLSSGWTADPGRGQLGTSYYTFTNGMTPSSSATWSATVAPNACYEIYAYVPDGHSNSYQAQYAIGSASSSAPVVSVDENGYTNGFAGLGVYRADGSGHLTVILTDRSLVSGDAYVAADTMSFVQTSCSPANPPPVPVLGATYPALTAGPGSPLTQFSLTNDWYNRFGHGDLGYEKWTHTNGTTAVSKATWTFTSGLSANTTYHACAYIPDNYANNTAAHYQGFQGTSSTATFSSLINQNTTTGWTYLGLLNPGTSGKLTVVLDDTGPTTTAGAPSYTAADAVRLTTGNC
ncbi:MAG TPA: CHAP domain-containing protein [Actinocrinis sp.]|uniref:golvesin C-terminal-like domain-containing protein n=1 Tax=Actinocrinis sp. TaxID=1920516 RepID=UPI002D2F936C|nr:CHAP domain-containing protein [Actinocrinis sp.]HZU58505.1 CHAP domain-containing protein [Actinocrinis sp.]